MRKVITGAFVSWDGVMQAPGGPEEDPTRGFKFGGWVVPYTATTPHYGNGPTVDFFGAFPPPNWKTSSAI